MIKKVIERIIDERLIERGEKIIVGFSGGPDSVFLLEVLLNLKKIINIEIILVHINHLLRGKNADDDEEFSRKIGERYNLKFYIKRADISKISNECGIGLEEAGREIRYNFFNEILELEKGDKIAIAHNLDDQVENFLFRLIRGSSLRGLKGINHRDKIIRPINKVYKSDIMRYLESNNISYRIDETNFKNEFTRNSIRLDLIPFIEERYNKRFKDKVVNLMEDIKALIPDEVEMEGVVVGKSLYLERLMEKDRYMQRLIVREFLENYGIDISRDKIENVLKLAGSKGSKKIDLSNEFILRKEYDIFYLERKDIEREKVMEEIEVTVPFKVEYNGYILEGYEDTEGKGRNEFLTNLAVGDRIKIRKRREGDRIVPLGMRSNKKVKEILINEKIPKDMRDLIPIIEKGDEIIWIAGVKKSENYNSKEKGIKLIIKKSSKND